MESTPAGHRPRLAPVSARPAPTDTGVTTHRYRPEEDRPWETPGTLLHRWHTSMGSAGMSERTRREWVQVVTRIARETGCPPEGLDVVAIESWLNALRGRDGGPARPGTKAAYVVALTAWHRWLVRNDLRLDNPMDRLGRVRVPRSEPRPITTADLERLLRTQMRARTRVMIHLGAYQGLRVHEIARVRGEDVDLVNRRLQVTGKGGVTATIPLHDVVAADALWMPRRGWWFPSPERPGPIRRDSVSTAISHAMRRAEVRGTAHQLRHWYATELVRAGVNLRIVQTLMRHASLQTTARYTKIDEQQARDALAALPTPREYLVA